MDNEKEASPGTWLKARTNRYVADDFALSLSPPTCEESYFSQHAHSRHSKFSLYDRINQELNSVEKSPSLTQKESKCMSPKSALATLSISSAGVYIDKEAPQNSESSRILELAVSKDEGSSPLLLFPLSDDEDNSDSISDIDSEYITRTTESDLNSKSVSPSILKALNVGLNNEETRHYVHNEKEPIVDKCQLTCESLTGDNQSSTTKATPITTMAEKPGDDSLVDKYFYTGKPLTDLVQSGSISAKINASITGKVEIKPEKDVAASSAALLQMREKQLAEASKLTSTEFLDNPKSMKRRPKQTMLREMNFWAPQSM